MRFCFVHYVCVKCKAKFILKNEVNIAILEGKERRIMSSEIKPTQSLDVRGEVCPYPDVMTQKKVKSMKPGEILEVLIDYPLSAERIPESMKKMGHEVLKVDKIGSSEWKILIKIK